MHSPYRLPDVSPPAKAGRPERPRRASRDRPGDEVAFSHGRPFCLVTTTGGGVPTVIAVGGAIYWANTDDKTIRGMAAPP